ncbi:MAG: two-component sensor histidine kinase [Sneathiella sp.]|jgi:two-component system OmpR family sensor kinase|uniref:sensor histidine kinase n=1 Tax=Sneathiella sp. TaxID=1964365 RepID=UPI000C41A3E6|nr:ATP-binding protein [Sneathiella sp.]MAL80735.1 two-component sensor histidine kinase [Sneathiella sp.]
MKIRLFWKILIGFWITLFLIMQGVWLLAVLVRDGPIAPDRWLIARVAPVALPPLQQALTDGGPAAFERVLATLPEEDRARIHLLTADAAANRPEDPELIERLTDATAPDGARYVIAYQGRQSPRRSHFRPPMEFIVVGAAGGFLFSAILAWYITSPIRRLRYGLNRLAHGDLDVRLEPKIGRRRDEIADLARDFDLTATHLRQAMEARDRLFHDVSHELRSPLTRLQLAIELARQDPSRMISSMNRIEREARRLDDLIDELLTFARSENSLTQSDEFFDLVGVVESVIADATFEATTKGVHINPHLADAQASARPSIQGRAELIRRAIENVIRNAIRYSATGQQIDVTVRFDTAENTYTVEILDEGPGLTEAEIEKMFEPFIRHDERSGGFGLGLTIAKRAVDAHNGNITARNRPTGGLNFTIRLPISSG